jgi:hypothetical protein
LIVLAFYFLKKYACRNFMVNSIVPHYSVVPPGGRKSKHAGSSFAKMADDKVKTKEELLY